MQKFSSKEVEMVTIALQAQRDFLAILEEMLICDDLVLTNSGGSPVFEASLEIARERLTEGLKVVGQTGESDIKHHGRAAH